MGLSISPTISRADTVLQQELNLDPDETPICVIPLGVQNWSQNAKFPKGVDRRSSTESKMLSRFFNLGLSEIMPILFAEAKSDSAEPNDCISDLPAIDGGSKMDGIPLSKPIQNGVSLGRVLSQRRSTRSYSTSPVNLDLLATVLASGCASESHASPYHDFLLPRFTYRIVANNVLGVAKGLYDYKVKNHALVALGVAPERDHMATLYVQPEFASAPFAIWILGDMTRTCYLDGARGHRNLLMLAGAVGYSFLLSGLSIGLSGSLIAGLVHTKAREYLKTDNFALRPLFAVALGHVCRDERNCSQ
jgi:Nitroreductase family